MAQILVRNLDAELKERLRRRAATHGRSMEEEVRDILRNALGRDDASRPVELGTRISRRFAGLGLLEEELPELRGQEARAADLDR